MRFALSRSWLRISVFPLLHLLLRRLQPPREHHRRRPRKVPRALPQPRHHQVGHLPLHLRRPAPSGVPGEVRGQPETRAAAHPLRSRFRRLRRRRTRPGPPARRVRNARTVAARMDRKPRPAAELPRRRQDAAEQRQDRAHRKPVAHAGRHPTRDLRVPARQPLRARMGRGSVPRHRRRPQRHPVGPQPRGRSAVHRPPRGPGGARRHRDRAHRPFAAASLPWIAAGNRITGTGSACLLALLAPDCLRIQARRAEENSPWRKPWETARRTKPRHGAKDCGGAIFRPLRGLWGTHPIPMAHAMGYFLSPCGLEKRPCVLATHELPRIPSESAIPLSCPTPEEHRRRRPAAVLVYTEYAKHSLWKISRSSFAKCRTFPSRAFSFTTSPPCSRTGAGSVR